MQCDVTEREYSINEMANFKHFSFKNHYNFGILVFGFSSQNDLRNLLLTGDSSRPVHPELLFNVLYKNMQTFAKDRIMYDICIMLELSSY